MDINTLKRYAPGGDIHEKLTERFNKAGAYRVYRAALDEFCDGAKGRVSEEIALLKHGPTLETNPEKFL